MDELPPLLVVEDEVLIRADISDQLESGGYKVVQLADGPAAISEIDALDAICGVITDVRLGNGCDGWEVARHARQRFPAVPVVYITGDSAAKWTANGVPNSIVLQKPFAYAQLLTAISTLLNSPDGSRD